MMEEKTLKNGKYLRTKTLLYSVVSGAFASAILIKENAEPRALIFIPIGVMALTLVYFKMNAFIKRLERMSQL